MPLRIAKLFLRASRFAKLAEGDTGAETERDGMRELLRVAFAPVDVDDEAEGSATGTGMVTARVMRTRWTCGKIYTTGCGGMDLVGMSGGH